MTTRRAARMAFSTSYLDEELAFIVPDRRRADFADAEWIRSTSGLRVAVPDLPYLLDLISRDFPGLTTIPIEYSDAGITNFFKGQGEPVDALVLTAQRGAFQTLIYPAFSVAVPQPIIRKIPLAYPVARHDVEAARFLSNWIELKKKDGTIQTLYEHWVLGQDASPHKPRWSILRNVLHWLD